MIFGYPKYDSIKQNFKTIRRYRKRYVYDPSNGVDLSHRHEKAQLIKEKKWQIGHQNEKPWHDKRNHKLREDKRHNMEEDIGSTSVLKRMSIQNT